MGSQPLAVLACRDIVRRKNLPIYSCERRNEAVRKVEETTAREDVK